MALLYFVQPSMYIVCTRLLSPPYMRECYTLDPGKGLISRPAPNHLEEVYTALMAAAVNGSLEWSGQCI